ncbi:hypothetical protein AB0H88_41125 [Nonomuraea sp. NPDC050680]|uniref:hypothetical protein n=1 Tax=Nonomuraea sp. NPDC050680 TaxID=3154630 RepID=UPI0033D5FC3E
MTELVEPSDGEQGPVLGDDSIMHAWWHCPGRVRTNPEEFLAVSGLSDHEQQLLRGRYRWADDQV